MADFPSHMCVCMCPKRRVEKKYKIERETFCGSLKFSVVVIAARVAAVAAAAVITAQLPNTAIETSRRLWNIFFFFELTNKIGKIFNSQSDERLSKNYFYSWLNGDFKNG